MVKIGLKFDVSRDKNTIRIDEKTKFKLKHLEPTDFDCLSHEDIDDLINMYKTINERKLPGIWKPNIPRMAFFHNSKKLIFTGGQPHSYDVE